MVTRGLLHNPQLQERIAENINKARLQAETSFRDDGTVENNLSYKSVVEATETDLIFEDFLNEIFSVNETDTSH